EGWQLYIPSSKAYSFWIPKANRKVFQQSGSYAVRGTKVSYTAVECEIKDDIKINAATLAVPVKKGEEPDFVTVIESVRDSHVKKLDGKVAKESDIKLGKVEGKEYVIDHKSGEKTILRLYLTETRKTLYQLLITGTKEQVEGEKAKLVLNSFQHAGMV